MIKGLKPAQAGFVCVATISIAGSLDWISGLDLWIGSLDLDLWIWISGSGSLDLDLKFLG
ncbi:MAG TPA: hypothetical protein DCQ51_02130 [Planktothrix sp. UBA8407]|nr:hypothetical protein [Planktothrix sp. UBA8407]